MRETRLCIALRNGLFQRGRISLWLIALGCRLVLVFLQKRSTTRRAQACLIHGAPSRSLGRIGHPAYPYSLLQQDPKEHLIFTLEIILEITPVITPVIRPVIPHGQDGVLLPLYNRRRRLDPGIDTYKPRQLMIYNVARPIDPAMVSQRPITNAAPDPTTSRHCQPL